MAVATGGPITMRSPSKARGIGANISYSGLAEKMRFLELMEVRALTWYETADALFDIFERSERNVFAQVSPALVITGDLKRSLTERHAMGAIREAGPEGVNFGTSIPYARAAASRKGVYMVRITKSSYAMMRPVIAGWIRGQELRSLKK